MPNACTIKHYTTTVHIMIIILRGLLQLKYKARANIFRQKVKRIKALAPS